MSVHNEGSRHRIVGGRHFLRQPAPTAEGVMLFAYGGQTDRGVFVFQFEFSINSAVNAVLGAVNVISEFIQNVFINCGKSDVPFHGKRVRTRRGDLCPVLLPVKEALTRYFLMRDRYFRTVIEYSRRQTVGGNNTAVYGNRMLFGNKSAGYGEFVSRHTGRITRPACENVMRFRRSGGRDYFVAVMHNLRLAERYGSIAVTSALHSESERIVYKLEYRFVRNAFGNLQRKGSVFILLAFQQFAFPYVSPTHEILSRRRGLGFDFYHRTLCVRPRSASEQNAYGKGFFVFCPESYVARNGKRIIGFLRDKSIVFVVPTHETVIGDSHGGQSDLFVEVLCLRLFGVNGFLSVLVGIDTLPYYGIDGFFTEFGFQRNVVRRGKRFERISVLVGIGHYPVIPAEEVIVFQNGYGQSIILPFAHRYGFVFRVGKPCVQMNFVRSYVFCVEGSVFFYGKGVSFVGGNGFAFVLPTDENHIFLIRCGNGKRLVRRLFVNDYFRTVVDGNFVENDVGGLAAFFGKVYRPRIIV